MEYKGFWKTINEEPDDHIMVFCSDWNKEHWAFYAYIDLENWEDDINELNDLISVGRLNFRDGDYYIELIDHSGQDLTKKIYHKHYERGYMSHSSVLNSNEWEEIIEEIENEPPTFTDGYEAQEYLEEILGKDYLYNVLQNWTSRSEWLTIYERYNQGLV